MAIDYQRFGFFYSAAVWRGVAFSRHDRDACSMTLRFAKLASGDVPWRFAKAGVRRREGLISGAT